MNTAHQTTEVEIRHAALFCGLGGGARGLNRAHAELNGLRAHFRCIGGIDVDPAAIKDFERLTGVRGTVMDLFDREQYRAFHGCEPPADWREATPEDIRRAYGYEHPHVMFTSAPCKGFSGLLSEKKSKTEKYQALNRLTLRGIWLTLEAWADDPVPLILFENVPRIATRGRHLLNQIVALLRHYGYAVAETVHDCGELGGLAQSRKRFLLVARHTEKVRPFLYEPQKRSLRSVGSVLSNLPMPGDPRGGPMHTLPELQWKTWVRLAFVEAGSDWRSLNRLKVVDGKLADYLIVPECFNDTLGVVPWTSPSGTVTGMAAPTRGEFSVADPRPARDYYDAYRVVPWDSHRGAVTSGDGPSNGGGSVADPRFAEARHKNVFTVVRWDEARGTVTSGHGPTCGGGAVADPRYSGHEYGQFGVHRWNEPMGVVTSQRSPGQGPFSVADPRSMAQGRAFSKYAVTPWTASTGTVIGGDDSGAYAVADPRLNMTRGKGDNYLTAGHYGVVPWGSPTGAVSAAANYDNGRWNVADPRLDSFSLPDGTENLVAMIRSLDGTWHRPFTTLELAVLQNLIDPEDIITLEGTSDGAWRERIGNAIPSATATAIGETVGRTLLMQMSGETFQLSEVPIWVRPVAVALSVDTPVSYGTI